MYNSKGQRQSTLSKEDVLGVLLVVGFPIGYICGEIGIALWILWDLLF